MERFCCHFLSASIALGATTSVAWPLQDHTAPFQTKTAVQPHNDVRNLRSLQRMVRHFDFEEAEQAPYDMPLNFYRYGGEDGAAAQGFAPFGSIKLTNEIAYSGKWSFEFELDGTSLAARVPTAVLPVVPLTDYAVTARIRTADLDGARARIAAWLHDANGSIIEQSRTVSHLIKTHGQWQTHTVEVRGDFEHATDLVLELQLLQPRQFAQRHTDGMVLLDEIGGRAWFDDVTVWHLPRIELSTSHPGNIILDSQSDTPPALTVLVRDLPHENPIAHLRIFDIHGVTVHEEQFAAPRLPRPHTVTLPSLRYGWYRAVLDLADEDGHGDIVARRWVDFAMLAPTRRSADRPDPRFGIVLDDMWHDHLGELASIIQRNGAGSVILPMWTSASSGVFSPSRIDRMRQLLHELSTMRVRMTLAIHTLPEDLANVLDVSKDDVVGAFALYSPRDVTWRESLRSLLSIGTEVHQWQLGATQLSMPNTQQRIDQARHAIGQLVASPVLVMPFSAEQPIKRDLKVDARAIDLPNEIRPDAIGHYAAIWRENPSPMTLKLNSAPATPEGPYTQYERLQDLFFRALHGIRAGVPSMHINAPWSIDAHGQCSPDPAYVLWRQVAEHLHNRRFVGEMQLGDAGKCWLFQGQRSGDDVLVAWSWRESGDQLLMQLADHPVRVVDLFGNAQTVALSGTSPGEHRIKLSRSPVFIEGINLPLVQFRGGFALDPPFIPAEHRTHQHEIVLRNPWDTPLSGTLVLIDKPQWTISPRSHDFNIEANGEVRLPLEISFERSVMADESLLQAEVHLQADGNYRLALSAPVQIGLAHADFSVAWRVVTNAATGRDDLVITQYITNTAPPGSAALYADAMVRAQGVRQERRIVAGLEPGDMTIRMFHIPDGAARLAGQTIRISLSDRNGLGLLNRELHIPAFTGSTQRANVTSSEADDR